MRFSTTISFVITFVIISCTVEDREKQNTSKSDNNQVYIESIPVEHFNNTPPFFSTIKNQAMKWNTVDESDSSKKFEYKESYIRAVNDQIIKCKIVDNEITINHGIHTGMSLDAVKKHFTNLHANHSASEGHPIVKIDTEEIYISCCDEGSQYWKFKFQGDSLYEINYYQYVP